jgi:hypothetical protein
VAFDSEFVRFPPPTAGCYFNLRRVVSRADPSRPQIDLIGLRPGGKGVCGGGGTVFKIEGLFFDILDVKTHGPVYS